MDWALADGAVVGEAVLAFAGLVDRAVCRSGLTGEVEAEDSVEGVDGAFEGTVAPGKRCGL